MVSKDNLKGLNYVHNEESKNVKRLQMSVLARQLERLPKSHLLEKMYSSCIRREIRCKNKWKNEKDLNPQ